MKREELLARAIPADEEVKRPFDPQERGNHGLASADDLSEAFEYGVYHVEHLTPSDQVIATLDAAETIWAQARRFVHGLENQANLAAQELRDGRTEKPRKLVAEMAAELEHAAKTLRWLLEQPEWV